MDQDKRDVLSVLHEQLINNEFDGDFLKTLSWCTAFTKELREEEAALNEQLSAVTAERMLVENKVMPRLMQKLKFSSFKTDDGREYLTKEFLSASIPKKDLAKREAALAWLNENGGGYLIKDRLIVESPTEEVIQDLTGKFRINRDRDVNTNSLKAFLSELLGVKAHSVARMSPEEVPSELHLFIETRAVVKGAKDSKETEGDNDE